MSTAVAGTLQGSASAPRPSALRSRWRRAGTEVRCRRPMTRC